MVIGNSILLFLRRHPENHAMKSKSEKLKPKETNKPAKAGFVFTDKMASDLIKELMVRHGMTEAEAKKWVDEH